MAINQSFLLTIHVDCCTDWNHETCDTWINAHVVETIDGDGHSGRTRAGTESSRQNLRHFKHITVWQFSNDHEEDDSDRSKAVNKQTEQDGHEVFSQLTDDLG